MQLSGFLKAIAESFPDASASLVDFFAIYNSTVDQLAPVFNRGIDWFNITNELREVDCVSGVEFSVRMQTMQARPTIVLPVFSAGQKFTASIVGYTEDQSPVVVVDNATNPVGLQTVNLRFLP